MGPVKWLVPAALALLLCVRAGALEAGAAKIDITPPPGAPLNGHSPEMARRAESVHDPVWVRCLYLDDGVTRLFLVTADLCVIHEDLRERVLAMAPSVVPRENIFLVATHNHSAQGGMCENLILRGVTGPYMPEVAGRTLRGLAEAMRGAYENRQTATIGYGTSNQDVLSRNRTHGPRGIDRQVGVIRVNDRDGGQIAILASFAAQATTALDADPTAVSADYPGAFYEEMERLSTRGCVAMFLNGACADVRANDPNNASGWERTENVGRLLAVQAKGRANTIDTSEMELKVQTAALELPPTLARHFMPRTVSVKTLEIGSLVLAFFPGVPSVEVAAGLRALALERGYEAQFTVSCANGHIGYIVPFAHYGRGDYEASMSFHGPGMAEMLTDTFARLFTRGEANPAPGAPAPGRPEHLEGGILLTVSGDPEMAGHAQGAAFAADIRGRFAATVEARVRDGVLMPDIGLWRFAPSFIDVTPVALPRLAMSARPALAAVPTDAQRHVAGLACGAGVPFDAVWLNHRVPALLDGERRARSLAGPSSTTFSVQGDRAGADGLLVGRNAYGHGEDLPLVRVVAPDNGLRYGVIGLPWMAGGYSGMNEAGLVVAVERVEALGDPAPATPPIELLVESILRTTAGHGDAVTAFRNAEGLRGYHVLLASPAGPDAVVLELGASARTRRADRGFLPGVSPDAEGVDEATAARYRRLVDLVSEDRIIAEHRIIAALADADETQPPEARVLNPHTRYSALFVPRQRRMSVAFIDARGEPTEFRSLSLEAADQ